jgi:hypothetical protein
MRLLQPVTAVCHAGFANSVLQPELPIDAADSVQPRAVVAF